MNSNFVKKSDRTARLLKLQVILWQYPKGLTVNKIADMCSVSTRTAYRDLKTLESELGVPVWEDGNKRGIVEGHFLPLITFSLKEATIIFLAARMMQNCFRLYNSSMASTFMKLNVIVPPPLREQIKNIIHYAEKQPRNDQKINNLNKIIEAWLSQHKVRIKYQDLSVQQPVERIIEPYFIEPAAEGRSYCIIAYCHHKKNIGVFKVERIVGDVVISQDTFNIPQDFNAIDYLGSAWGIYNDADVETVKLKFHKEISKAVVETVWHSSQETEIDTNGSVIMTLRVRNTVDFRAWVRGWGDKVEVLEPKTLRDRMLKTSKALVKMYATKRISTKSFKKVDQLDHLKNLSELTDEQWNRIIPVLPSCVNTGRPRANDRKTLNGILWVLSRNAKWADVPTRYGAPSTCHSRFQLWRKNGVLKNIVEILASS